MEAEHSSSALKIESLTSADFVEVRRSLAELRNPPKYSTLHMLSIHEREERCIQLIWNHLCDRGSFLHDSFDAYLFLSKNKQLVQIRQALHFDNILADYGLLLGDKLHKKTIGTIARLALTRGRRVELHSVSHFDAACGKLYLHLGYSKVARITAEHIDEVDNGTDGILFRDTGQAPFHVDLTSLPHHCSGLQVTGSCLDRVFEANWDGRPEAQHQLSVCILFALLFCGGFGAFPIVCHIGEHRSGKTTAALRPGMLLFGKEFSATMLNTNVKDVETALTSSPVIMLDNVDAGANLKAIENLVALVATGGKISRRQLFTDNTLISSPIVAKLSFTSRSMPFSRNDILDRTLTFKYRQFDSGTGTRARGEMEMKDAVLEQRDHLMAEVIGRCQMILRALDATKNTRLYSEHRMKDLSEFWLRVASYEGWLPAMQGILSRDVADQRERAAADNPIVTLLQEWATTQAGNFPRSLSARDLHLELNHLAPKVGTPYGCLAPNQLSKRLEEARTELKRILGLEISHDGKKNVKVFRFNPPHASPEGVEPSLPEQAS